MLLKKKIFWVYFISIVFIAINAFFIVNEKYFFTLLPIGILIVFLAFFSLDKLLLFIVFLTPLSIPLSEIIPGLNFNMFIPTEPLLFGVLLLFILKIAFEKKFDKKIIYHPVSLAIYINLIWILITSITSTMPIVSFKFLLARVWFIVSFYFLATQLFKNRKNIYRFIWLYILPLIIVIAYTIYNHSKYGLLNQEAANYVVSPFYNDHTIYGAMLALYIPLLIGFLFNSKYLAKFKFIISTVLAVFIFALVVSYTRAAWISLFGALFILAVILLKIKFRYIFFIGGALLTLFFVYQSEIIIYLERNRQDSSTNLSEHVKSIANISTDASNMERLNRWNCAIRMFKEKPVLGWGPGTYMFQYAPFQLSFEKTIISTNAGDKGNAHSEYLGALSESGFIGTISLLSIIIIAFFTALKNFRSIKDKSLKILLLSIILGLSTYFIHGFLNNFLDTDKASIPIWGLIAAIVAIDVYLNKNGDELKKHNKKSA